MAKQQIQTIPASMRGEGESTLSGVKFHGAQGNTGTVSFEIDLNTAAAPARKFVADAFNIQKNGASYRLLFGQTKIDGSGLRALIDLQATAQALTQLADTMFPMPIAEGSARAGLYEMTSEPAQAIAVNANFFRISFGPMGACIDCYYASPFSMQAGAKSGNLQLEGALRIQTNEELFLTVVDAILSLNLHRPTAGEVA